jgi:hypothetical protein
MRTRWLLICCCVILLAWATRLYHIDSQSIWFDEGWSAYAAAQPSLPDAVEADPTNPPLYYVLLNLTTRAFGDSEFGLRLTSALLGLLTIPLTGLLARRLFGHQAALFAVLLAACSPPLWWASQEARMYTLLAALVLLAALGWHRLMLQPDRRAWIILLGAETLLLYAHNTGPVIVLWLNGAALLLWLSRMSLRRPDWRIWLGGQALVGLLWLPWFLTRFINVQAANSAITTGPQIGLDLFSRIWQAFWTAPWEMVGREPAAMGFAAAALLALALIPFRQANARWLIIHVALLTSGLLVGLGIIGNEMHGRYLVMVVPLLLAALGAGIARLRWPLLRYGISSGFVALLLVNVHLAQNPLYQHDDARGMVRYYADTLTPDDTVLAWSYADRYDLAYYWDRLGVTARRVTLPEGADWEHVKPLLPQSGRVAVNKWYTQRADYRNMLSCALEQGSVNAPVEHTTYGMTSLLYDSVPEMPEFQLLDAPILYNGLPFVRVTESAVYPVMTAERALCVPVELRVDQPLSVDLRAAVILRNLLGRDIAQSSGIFATANQRTTSAVVPGETVSAYVLLRLPYGAPPGDYDVLVRVFDDVIAPTGYDVVDEAGQITGNDLLLGTWQVEPGADWSQVQRETDLPYRMDTLVDNPPVLLAHNIAPEGAVQPGQRLTIEMLWQANGERLPTLMLTGDTGWNMTILPQPGPRDAITLDWRQAIIPSNAAGGAVRVALSDGKLLATYIIEAIPRINQAPQVDVEVNRGLGEVGRLIGVVVGHEPADRSQPFPVTLVWRAGYAEIRTNYTVFAQLLDSQGRLIAQSDSIPARGDRPTTGWRAAEYIIDMHMLQFNELAAPGDARLIVGMYDALTGRRVLLEPDGLDFIEVPGTISVR